MISAARFVLECSDPSRSLEAVDLFCGMGGATQGLKDSGLNVVLAVDNNKNAVVTHRSLFPDCPCWLSDVKNIRPSQLAGRIVWASPSCKPYSIANRSQSRGVKHNEYYSLAYLLDQCSAAKCLIIENVQGLKSSKEGKAELAELEKHANKKGIPFQLLEVCASQVGLKQSRKRVFLVFGVSYPVFVSRVEPSNELAPCVTTKINTKLLDFACTLQNVTNPTGRVSDARSARRRFYGKNAKKFDNLPRAELSNARGGLSNSEGVRLVGNVNPPILTSAVVKAVLSALNEQEQHTSLFGLPGRIVT